MKKIRIKSVALLAVVFLLLGMIFTLVNLVTSSFLFREGHVEDGVLIHRVISGPSVGVLNEGEVIYRVDDRVVSRLSDMLTYLNRLEPGDKIVIKTNVSEYTLTLSSNPSQKGRTFMGALLKQNYKERPVPLIKEVLLRMPSLLVSTCIIAVLVYSIVFVGLGNVLLAFFGPAILATTIGRMRATREGAYMAVYPGFREPAILGLILALILLLLLFVAPAWWVKRDDKDYFKKTFLVYLTLLLFLEISKIYYQGFEASDALLLPVSLAFLSLWSILLDRIFSGRLKQHIT